MKMNIVAYALVFLLALQSNNAEINHSSCQKSGCQTGSVCVDTNNDLCNSESTTNCQCKQENFKGLFVTLYSTKPPNDNLYMIPTAPDGTPILENIPSSVAIADYNFGDLLSIDVDYTLQQAYLYDNYKRVIYKDQNCSIDLSGYNNWKHLHRGISFGNVRLAVDWISHNIYWTDPHFKWIMVQSLLSNDQSMYHVLIYDNLEGPHALALDPIEGLLFWSDIGRVTKIEVSSLSGTNRQTLLASNLGTPTSMAADHLARRIYFTDRSRSTIETVTYEGRDRKIVFKKYFSDYDDIAVYKDYLYVTDGLEVYFLNKTNGNLLHNIAERGATFFAVTVFRPEAQPISTKAHCDNYGCDHICVTEKDGATCLCKDGYTLNQDKKKCSLRNEYFQRGVIYSNESNICIMDIRSIADFVFDQKCVLDTTGTNYMALDTDQRKIFFANDTTIYWAGVDNLELHLLAEPTGIISGMAWDGYDRNLYWTEENTGFIWRVPAESENKNVFLEGLNKPRDILILSHERRVYWISEKNGSTIETSNINGSYHQIILDSNHLVNPRSLSYDPYRKRIYFIDDEPDDELFEGVVNSCNLDGSDLKTILSLYGDYKNLEIYKGHALVTATFGQNTQIQSRCIETRLRTTSSYLSGHITAIKVFDETIRQNETGPCFNLNGGCEQICISNGKSMICECTFGFRLAENGKTCISDPIKDNFMLVGDSTNFAIYQISLTDQSVQGISAQGKYSAMGVTYSPVHDLVIEGTDGSDLSIMHLNGTGRKLLSISTSGSRDLFPYKCAVDYSTGNFYCIVGNGNKLSFKNERYISLISPEGKHRVLVKELAVPYGIVVYPSKGMMFFTDMGLKPYLGRANMDGSQSAVLLNNSRITAPRELTIDYKTDCLYWISWPNRIESCNIDGENWKILIEYPGFQLLSLSLYQDYLFLSTDEHTSMIKVQISNPNETIKFAAHAELGNITTISVYSSAVQNKNALCSVDNGGCSTFCFPVPDGRKCGCEDGVELKEGSSKDCSNILE